MKKGVLLLLICLMPVMAWGQHIDVSVKSIFATQQFKWEGETRSLDLVELGINKKQTLSELSIEMRLTERMAFFYNSLSRMSGECSNKLDYDLTVNGVEFKKDDSKLPLCFETSMRRSAIGVEYWLFPNVHPLLKVEQVVGSLSIRSEKKQVTLDRKVSDIGVGCNFLFRSSHCLGQARTYYLTGTDLSGWDLDTSLRFYLNGIHSFMGAGYKYRDLQIRDIRFSQSGPYLEIGVAF